MHCLRKRLHALHAGGIPVRVLQLERHERLLHFPTGGLPFRMSCDFRALSAVLLVSILVKVEGSISTYITSRFIPLVRALSNEQQDLTSVLRIYRPQQDRRRKDR